MAVVVVVVIGLDALISSATALSSSTPYCSCHRVLHQALYSISHVHGRLAPKQQHQQSHIQMTATSSFLSGAVTKNTRLLILASTMPWNRNRNFKTLSSPNTQTPQGHDSALCCRITNQELPIITTHFEHCSASPLKVLAVRLSEDMPQLPHLLPPPSITWCTHTGVCIKSSVAIQSHSPSTLQPQPRSCRCASKKIFLFLVISSTTGALQLGELFLIL